MQSPATFEDKRFKPVPPDLLDEKQGGDKKQDQRGDLATPGKVAMEKSGSTLRQEIGINSAKHKTEPAKNKANIPECSIKI